MSRKKSSLAQDIIEITAMLPWWAGVSLAVAIYCVLGWYLAEPPATIAAAGSGHTAALVVTGFKRQLAAIGQYVLPILFLVGAAVSAWRRYRSAALLDKARIEPSALAGVSWREFELLVGEAFRGKGYSVTENSNKGPDGGIDLRLKKHNETYLVQCKQWRAVKVGVTVVRELYGVMAATGAAGGFVVTSGRFTPEAEAFAQGRNITLMDGAYLKGFIGTVQTATSLPPAVPVAKVREAAGGCPVCGGAMVERSAKRGPNAGARFLGCARYPACRGTAALS